MARSHKHRVPAAFGGIMDTKTGRKRYFLGSVWDWITDKAQEVTFGDLAKGGASAFKAYMDYKDAKRRNELEEAAYDDYMKAAEEAGQEARAAIDLNLTPMVVSGIPTSKADVTDYTAATGLKHGGISGLRKKYARGPGETEVLEMDEEVITPYDLQKEEGVEIGEQVFYNTGRGDRANAMMIWEQMSVPDKSIFDFDFELFFQDGGWRDMIKGEAPSGKEDKMMASAPSMEDSQNEAAMQLFNKPYNELNEMELQMFQEEMSKYMAKGGIAGLRKKYSMGTPDTDVEIMDEEFVGDNELKMEEGVKIGPMAGPDWYIKRVEHLEYLGYSYEEASEIAFDNDRYYEIVGMESAIPKGDDPDRPPIYLPKPGDTPKGIMTAAKGGRARYDSGTDWIVKKSDVEEEASPGPMGRAGAQLSPDQLNTKEFDINDLVISIDDKNTIYMGEPVIVQDVMTGKWKVMGKDGRVVEFDTIEEAQAYTKQFAKGGRARKANGGIMDMGGLEKDYRFSGGFVPIGEYERKDDVPARLSKNEFVFTADAVRAAGGGSINKGAKRMYETMKNLEARPEAKRMTA